MRSDGNHQRQMNRTCRFPGKPARPECCVLLALLQAVEIFLRGGAGPQRFVLAAQDCDYFFATLRGKLKTLCNLLDGVEVWTVRIQTGNIGEIVNESDK